MVTNIDYKFIQNFRYNGLERLFLSVEWSSGHFPEKLAFTMQNFKIVYSAWDGDKLIGMIYVMDDKVMSAYIHYLLVGPDYQGHVIGGELVQMVKGKCRSFTRIAMTGYNKETNFYENYGFVKSEDCSPLFITSLWT